MLHNVFFHTMQQHVRKHMNRKGNAGHLKSRIGVTVITDKERKSMKGGGQ